MHVSGVHRAPIEREYRGFSWFWPGYVGPPSPAIAFTSFAFHPAYAVLGTRLRADRAGASLAAGLKGDLAVPFPCIIRRMTLLADAAGSAVIDIYRAPLASFPPIATQTLIGEAPFRPTLANAQSQQDTALFTWTTTLNQGDILAFDVLTISGIGTLTLSLFVERIGQN